MPKDTYILRARVIEGSIPMPGRNDPLYAGLTEDNFEIIALYTKENLQRLFDIGKEAYMKGTLSKYEILAWAGGAANHDGDRFLWSTRPDKFHFEMIDSGILESFDTAKTKSFDRRGREYYDKFWKPLKYGFSINAYESMVLEKKSKSLLDRINAARGKAALQPLATANNSILPER